MHNLLQMFFVCVRMFNILYILLMIEAESKTFINRFFIEVRYIHKRTKLLYSSNRWEMKFMRNIHILNVPTARKHNMKENVRVRGQGRAAMIG